jgi:hypothetical protein
MFKAAYLCPDDIRQSFSHSHPGACLCVDEHLDWLLPDRRGCSGQPEMALSDYCHVTNRQLERAAALLLRDQSGDAPVNFIGEKPL